MKNLKWLAAPFFWLCPRKIWNTLIFQKNELNGTGYVREIVLIASLRMQQAIFPPEVAVVFTRNMIRESWDCLKKNSGVQKCCVGVAKPIVATMERVKSTNSVAGDSIKDLWKTVEMDTCQSIAKCEKS